MAKDPAFLFYDGDASKDVSHMNRLCRGAYFDIIQAQRKFCSSCDGNAAVMPDGMPEDTIKMVLGRDFEEVWPSIKLILFKNGDSYYIPWLKESITNRENHCKKQSEKARKRWNSHGNAAAYARAMPPENEIENISSGDKSVREGGSPVEPKDAPPDRGDPKLAKALEDAIEKSTVPGLSKKSQAGRYSKGGLLSGRKRRPGCWYGGDKWKESAKLDTRYEDREHYIDDLHDWIEGMSGQYISRLEEMAPEVDIRAERWSIFSYFKRTLNKKVDHIDTYIESCMKNKAKELANAPQKKEVEDDDDDDEDWDTPYIRTPEELKRILEGDE